MTRNRSDHKCVIEIIRRRLSVESRKIQGARERTFPVLVHRIDVKPASIKSQHIFQKILWKYSLVLFIIFLMLHNHISVNAVLYVNADLVEEVAVLQHQECSHLYHVEFCNEMFEKFKSRLFSDERIFILSSY